jgi:hypothetical protein
LRVRVLERKHDPADKLHTTGIIVKKHLAANRCRCSDSGADSQQRGVRRANRNDARPHARNQNNVPEPMRGLTPTVAQVVAQLQTNSDRTLFGSFAIKNLIFAPNCPKQTMSSATHPKSATLKTRKQ